MSKKELEYWEYGDFHLTPKEAVFFFFWLLLGALPYMLCVAYGL